MCSGYWRAQNCKGKKAGADSADQLHGIIVASKQGLSMAGEALDEALAPSEVHVCSGGLHAFCCPSVSLPPSL